MSGGVERVAAVHGTLGRIRDNLAAVAGKVHHVLGMTDAVRHVHNAVSDLQDATGALGRAWETLSDEAAAAKKAGDALRGEFSSGRLVRPARVICLDMPFGPAYVCRGTVYLDAAELARVEADRPGKAVYFEKASPAEVLAWQVQAIDAAIRTGKVVGERPVDQVVLLLPNGKYVVPGASPELACIIWNTISDAWLAVDDKRPYLVRPATAAEAAKYQNPEPSPQE